MRSNTAPSPTRSTRATGRSGVNGALTMHRLRPVMENCEFARFVRRTVSAHSRRLAYGDIEGLRDLDALGRAREAATLRATTGLRDAGCSVGRRRPPARRHPSGRASALGR